MKVIQLVMIIGAVATCLAAVMSRTVMVMMKVVSRKKLDESWMKNRTFGMKMKSVNMLMPN